MDNKYGGVIWTNHALERLKQRNVQQGDAWATWNRPDRSKYDPSKGVWVYNRVWGDVSMEVVAKQNERKEWLILSVWSNSVSGNRKDNKPISFWSFLFNRIFKK